MQVRENRSPSAKTTHLSPCPLTVPLQLRHSGSMPCGHRADRKPPTHPAHGHSQRLIRTASSLGQVNEHGHDAPCLEGLVRRSNCCNSPIVHPFSAKSAKLSRVLSLQCANCGKLVQHFRVLNSNGEQIWPVPCPVKVSRRHLLVGGVESQNFHILRVKCLL